MRVAVLYDIHGNLPALEAALEEVHQARVDQIVVGGDVGSLRSYPHAVRPHDRANTRGQCRQRGGTIW